MWRRLNEQVSALQLANAKMWYETTLLLSSSILH